ncbi:tetratricopeptide repeat protein [Nocardia terpenica]|nr:tetratricopeptide repeat protein [Nocardia terpenica]
MTSVTQEKLKGAFWVEDGLQSARLVKQIVSESLSAADPAVRVVWTQYFNHTYIPDLVLEWPSRSVSASRRVYLRPTQNPLRIEMDVRENSASGPIFIHLADLSAERDESGESGLEVLSSVAHSTQSLVTEVEAFERLSTNSTGPGSNLLPSSVIRGGRGLLEAEQATETATIVSRGFAGAMAADPESTALALGVIGDILDPSIATEISTVLETMWIASGGAPLEYPGQVQALGLSISPQRLESLLQSVSADETEFWLSIGRGVTFESFESLHLTGEQKALQVIMRTALPNILVRTCRITETVRVGQKVDSMIWQVERGNLSLRGAGRQAWVGRRVGDLPRQWSYEMDRRPSPQILVSRSDSSGIPISAVEAVGGGRTITYRSSGNSDIRQDDFVTYLESMLGSESVVKRAVPLLEGGKPVTVDFTTNTAFGGPSARINAASLIWGTWCMIYDLTESEHDELTAVIGPLSQASEQAADATRFGIGIKEGRELPEMPTLRETPVTWRPAIDASFPVVAEAPPGMLEAPSRVGDPEIRLRRAAESGRSQAMLALADLLKSRGDSAEAEEWFRRLADSGHGEAMLELGELLERRGQLREAEMWLRRALDIGQSRAAFFLGELLRKRDRIGEAEFFYRRAIEGEPH